MIDPLNLWGTNKYMSREQLLLNMENGQKLQTAEKKEKIQTRILEVDKEDHNDLCSIIQNVDKKDVSANKLLFWEQQ